MNTILNFYVFTFLYFFLIIYTVHSYDEKSNNDNRFTYLLPSTRYLILILILNFLKQIFDACNRENP